MVSTNILTIVKHFEGFEAAPYRDSVDVLTVGYGFTMGDVSGVSLNKEISHYALYGLMHELLSELEFSIDPEKHSKPSIRALETYASLAYNVGLTAVLESKSWAHVLNGERVEAAANFLQFRSAGGKVEFGLQRRRMSEVYYWLTGKVEFYLQEGMFPRRVTNYFKKELGSQFL